MSHAKRTAAVIGGSLTGLITARLLALDGWEVHVFERVPEDLAGRGAGIGTHAELFDVLRAANIPITADLGIQVRLRRLFSRDGAVLLEQPYPQVLTHWDRLYSLLRQYVPDQRYHLGKKLVSFAQTANGVAARFEDGSTFEADLLIGADGIRSTVRAALCPDAQPQFVSYVAWRGVVPEEALSAATRESMFDYFCFCLPVGEQMAGYPIRRVVKRGEPPARDYNFIWYRPTDNRQLEALLTDESGQRHEMNIPPPLVNPRFKEGVKEDAEAILAPQFAEAVRLADGLFCQPIYDVEVTRMVEGRVALLGDAAFVARPHVGAGVTKAFSDAMALSRALRRDIPVGEALLDFEHERFPIGRRILERARHLGAYMQASKNTEAERAFAEAYRRPEAVLRETASLDFMSDTGAGRSTGPSSQQESNDMTDIYDSVDLSQSTWPDWVKEDFRNQRGNACVGQVLADENERTRVWYLRLPPGGRIGFHTHVLDYFWTCVSGGRARSHVATPGKFEITEFDLKPGSTKFTKYPSGQFKVHDLENTGDKEILFVTVELLHSANERLPVPASVRVDQHDGARRVA